MGCLSTFEFPDPYQVEVDRTQKEAQVTREFVASQATRLTAKGQKLESHVTDNDSAKFATSKGVIQR